MCVILHCFGTSKNIKMIMMHHWMVKNSRLTTTLTKRLQTTKKRHLKHILKTAHWNFMDYPVNMFAASLNKWWYSMTLNILILVRSEKWQVKSGFDLLSRGIHIYQWRILKPEVWLVPLHSIKKLSKHSIIILKLLWIVIPLLAMVQECTTSTKLPQL